MALTQHIFGPVEEQVANPTVNDDSGAGFDVGTIWINTATDDVFIAADVAVGAAVWQGPVGSGGAGHDPVTLAADADILLGLTVQQLTLDVQAANLVFAGPAAGGAVDPTFRALVDADLPAGLMRDAEHTAIGDAAPHHVSFLQADADLLYEALGDIAVHAAIAGVHHAKYTDAEAITAVEAANPLDLTNALLADTINEHTLNAGVTVESITFRDNYIDLTGIAVPANPAAGTRRLFADSATGELSVRTNVGTTVSLEGAGGGGGTSIVDADGDTKVDVEEGADDDIVRMDVFGTERFLLQGSPAAAAAHLAITGRLSADDYSGIGNNLTLNDHYGLLVQHEFNWGANNFFSAGLEVLATDVTPATTAFSVSAGMGGNMNSSADAGTLAIGYGLNFEVQHSGPNDKADLIGVRIDTAAMGGASGQVTRDVIGVLIAATTAVNGLAIDYTSIKINDPTSWCDAASDEVRGIQIDEFDEVTTATLRRPFQYGNQSTSLWHLDHEGRQFMRETSTPTALVGMASLYIDTGGAGGRQRLMCLFESGAAQVVATEP